MLSFILGLLSLWGTTTLPVAAVEPPEPEPPTIEELIIREAEQAGVDSNLAVKIAYCESRLTQFTLNGEVLRGQLNRQDVGIFQINEKYHLKKSQELELNIYTLDGNIAYAMWLMKREGVKPWSWSRSCWQSLDI